MNPDFQIGEYMLAEHDLFLRVFSKYLKISILLGRDGEYQFQRSRTVVLSLPPDLHGQKMMPIAAVGLKSLIVGHIF